MFDQEIHRTLNALGIGHRFHGYTAVFDAVQLVLEDEDRLLNFYDHVLTPLGSRYQLKPRNIERNIRTISCHAWETSRDYLCSLAGYPLTKAPSVIELIEIIATSVSRGRTRR